MTPSRDEILLKAVGDTIRERMPVRETPTGAEQALTGVIDKVLRDRMVEFKQALSPPDVQVHFDLRALVASLDKLTGMVGQYLQRLDRMEETQTQIATTLAKLVAQMAKQQPAAIHVNPVIEVAPAPVTVHQPAPTKVQVVEAPAKKRAKRSFVIEHDDGTSSTITEA